MNPIQVAQILGSVLSAIAPTIFEWLHSPSQTPEEEAERVRQIGLNAVRAASDARARMEIG